jgi:hypothetical protein
MLKSYEAILDHSTLQWLGESPDVVKARIIVTILEARDQKGNARRAPDSIAGKGRTLGDIVAPVVQDNDWECLK